MNNRKSELIQLNISNHSVSYHSPKNYSKDFTIELPKTDYRVNMYEHDLYINQFSGVEISSLLHQSYWDYGKGYFSRKVNGTLLMSVFLYKSAQNTLDLSEAEHFNTTLKNDFEAIYDEKSQQDFSMVMPVSYKTQLISGLNWGYFKYSIRGAIDQSFSLYLSDKYYLKVTFSFIDNSLGKENNWKEQAQKTIDTIMLSFQLK